MPAPTTVENVSGRKVKTFFWINFLVEIVLLNIVFQLLLKYSFNEYLIPAISVVVGAHFIPLAFFMDVRQYFFCAIAMIVCAAIAISLIKVNAASFDLISAIEAIVNAAILWATAGLRIKITVV